LSQTCSEHGYARLSYDISDLLSLFCSSYLQLRVNTNLSISLKFAAIIVFLTLSFRGHSVTPQKCALASVAL
jgi:hypothetical protein